MENQEINKKAYEKRFPHFALRLSERYGLFITFQDFLEMNNLEVFNSKKELNYSYSCVIIYKSIPIKVIKSSNKHEKNILVTALNIKNKEYENLTKNHNHKIKWKYE